MEDRDEADVIALNAANVALLAPLGAPRLAWLRSLADRCDVVDVDGVVAGFVITFPPGTSYDSENYRWFGARHDDFYYLDRIVFDPTYRRRGLATLAYDALETVAARHGRMCLEVNAVPPNEPSLAFHAARGYLEVGRLGDDTYAVSLMEKPL